MENELLISNAVYQKMKQKNLIRLSDFYDSEEIKEYGRWAADRFIKILNCLENHGIIIRSVTVHELNHFADILPQSLLLSCNTVVCDLPAVPPRFTYYLSIEINRNTVSFTVHLPNEENQGAEICDGK
jgi:hypothetical protein